MTPTPEQMIREVVEATPGECWHEYVERCGDTFGHYYAECPKCGANDRVSDDYAPPNHSPDDLNALFRLARKLRVLVELNSDIVISNMTARVFDGDDVHVGYSSTSEAEALLHALWKAVKK